MKGQRSACKSLVAFSPQGSLEMGVQVILISLVYLPRMK